MSWGPDDWDVLARRDERDHGGVADLSARTLQETLGRIPERRRRSVLDVGGTAHVRLPLLRALFERVLSVPGPVGRAHPAAELVRITRHARPLDVVLAIDSLPTSPRTDLDRILRLVHDSLGEGGLFLGTFPRVARRGAPLRLRFGADAEGACASAFHEFELQYRLRRTGFQGLRIRCHRGEDGAPDTLLALAVRRALN